MTDQTINLDATSNQFRLLSSGSEGDALVGRGENDIQLELRVLTTASASRCDQIRRQLSLIELADHDCIRRLVQPLTDESAASFGLSIPKGVDVLDDRLSRRMQDLPAFARFRVAALLVDATESAHRIGLCHGSFSPSTILVSPQRSNIGLHIDFSGMAFSRDVGDVELSVDRDLENLHRLLADLLKPVLNADNLQEWEPLTGRTRALLRRWIKEAENAEEAKSPPSLGQWWSVLNGFLPRDAMDQTMEFDQTGIVAVPDMPIGSGSTSHMETAGQAMPITVDTIPQTIGRFRIKSKIGEGGMGAVYRGIDPTNHETVAVKVLRRTGKDIGQSVRRFRKEARLLEDVQNEHVTRLIEVGEDDGLHYLVMEFVDGVDLKSWFAGRSALPESEAVSLTVDLARSLVDAHAREIIHRDIKPENVLLQLRADAPDRDVAMAERPIADFTLKLSDFGIARHVSQSESLEMTRAGSVMGTPKYMSPEQCKSASDLTPSADVYSLGVTLFELLAGSVPYNSDDFMKIAAMHCFDPIPSLRKRGAAVTDSVERIVARSLAKEPAERFGDASQLLTELLKLQQGDAADWSAHPRLPEDHGGDKVWEKTVSWELQSEPADLWPMVSNTERLNEAIGLPAVEYRTEQDPVVGTRRFGSFTVSGMKVVWEEHPFEWIEGQRMGVLREFSSGPLKWYMSVVTLEPLPDGGTRLSHQLRVESRNLLGRVMTSLKMDREGFRNLERVYRRMDQSLAGRLPAQQGDDPFAKIKTISAAQFKRLSIGIERIVRAGADPDVTAKLSKAIETWSPQELARLRPLAAADQLGVSGAAMIDACLLAAHEGILNLRWDVLCPTCRVSADTKEELSQINTHANCEACDVDFQSNLAGAIEMVFQTHPEIREVNTQKYCIGGPVHSPHVVAQVRIDAGERLEVPLDLGIGNYLIRGPRLPRTQNLIVQSKAAPSNAEWSLSDLGSGSHTPKLREGRQTLTFTNDLDSLRIIRIERTIPRSDVVTAATASAHPLFRKLFPGQRFSEDNPIATETMTFLTTGINNVDQLYASLGDSDAYASIHRLHGEVTNIVCGASGTVVKTMGEQLLAAFSSRDSAVIAAFRIREHLGGSGNHDVVLGIGIHCGPTLVTTQNHQLDYFGGTVRAAGGLPDHAGGDTLVTESVYADPSVTGHLDRTNDRIEIIDLPGHPKTRTKRIKTTGFPS